eukprot:2647550-Rhodomonas_salina.5
MSQPRAPPQHAGETRGPCAPHLVVPELQPPDKGEAGDRVRQPRCCTAPPGSVPDVAVGR